MVRISKTISIIIFASSMSVCASSALASGDAAAGATLYKSCAMCHTVTKGGASVMGPNLFAIVGRKAGSLAGYSASPTMVASGVVWDESNLTKFLMSPSSVVPGKTKMFFTPFKKQEDAESVAAYLATLK